jgi:hypothetical protein
VYGGLTNVSWIVTATLIWNSAVRREMYDRYSMQVTLLANSEVPDDGRLGPKHAVKSENSKE